MAGDWIKMRVDLADDPAVIAIARDTELGEDTVVGKLHRLWSWADRQTTNGNAVGVTSSWVDRYVGVAGFANAMIQVGWLDEDGASVTFPKFDRHNGQSGKQRALTLKRVRNARGVTKPLPEKRREEKSSSAKAEPPLPPLPEVLDVEAFRPTLAKWLRYKSHKYKPEGLASMVSRAANLATEHGVASVVVAMERAMANGWKGWDQESSFTTQRAGPPSKTTREQQRAAATARLSNGNAT